MIQLDSKASEALVEDIPVGEGTIIDGSGAGTYG